MEKMAEAKKGKKASKNVTKSKKREEETGLDADRLAESDGKEAGQYKARPDLAADSGASKNNGRLAGGRG